LDQQIKIQKQQASKQHAILGWTLGVYRFLGILALVAWYFDVLPGFGKSVELIMAGRQMLDSDGSIEMTDI
jgi:hypothetical protein